VPIREDHVCEVTELVCGSLLGSAAVIPTGAPVPEGSARVSAWVSIVGAWNGRVEVRVSPALALRLVREVMQLEADSPDSPDVADIVGELANMIGGNLKGLLPPDCRMSVPHAGAAARAGSASTSAVDAVGASFLVDGESLEVVVERAGTREEEAA
jgi:chemotaxis protein CheX